jgi:iron complex transport system permease protein
MTQTVAAMRRWGGKARGAQQAPRLSPLVVLPGLAIGLIVALILSAGVGAVGVSPKETIGIIADHLGVHLGIAYEARSDIVIWSIRLPRVVLAALVGGALGISGAALQGMFRNPLADPGFIGVSSGASLAAVSVISLGITWLGSATVPVAASIGASFTVALAYGLSRYGGRTEVITLVLAGVAVSTLTAAATSFITYVQSGGQPRSMVFWTLGGLGGATWETVRITLPFVALGILITLRHGTALNVLALGEREAGHLGVDVERVRIELLLLTSILVGASVAAAGVVAFIGLIVPHIVRLVSGPDNRVLLPASALGGATLVLAADLIARTVASPAELPLGILTALAGGPCLLLLMLRVRRQQGGWG